MRLLLGGPAYRMELDARHATSMMMFSLRITRPNVIAKKGFGGRLRHIATPSPFEIVAIHYQHGNPVEYTRNSMFESALRSDATHLLWLDADNAIPFEGDRSQILPIALGLTYAEPILIVPSQERQGGTSNVWESREKKLARIALDGEVRECYAGGFGCVGFNLAWYREKWPKAPWFRSAWDDTIVEAGGTSGYVGEDYNHCRQLVALGGKVKYVGAYVDHHARGSE